jgi:hypothetical protein
MIHPIHRVRDCPDTAHDCGIGARRKVPRMGADSGSVDCAAKTKFMLSIAHFAANSFRSTTPPFMTNFTDSNRRTSEVGSPATAMISAK